MNTESEFQVKKQILRMIGHVALLAMTGATILVPEL